MIAVLGHLNVDPARRDELLTLTAAAVRSARTAPGCLHFSVAPDPVADDRVSIAELWLSRDHLERFRGEGPDAPIADLILDADVGEYDVTG